MRRVMVGIAITAALAIAIPASAAVTLKGTYTSKIAAPAQLKGTWGLHFVGYPRYTITLNARVVVRGHYATVGNTIQFNDDSGSLACKQFGVYRLKLTTKAISFTRTNDPCPGRSAVLAHRFRAGA
jgi:hypothetical protein